MDVVLQFPGQLSEHVGMAATALTVHPDSARRLEEAEAATGLPVARLVREGPEAELHGDRAAAVATVVVSQMMLDGLTARCGARVQGVAGHSVGYTSALLASGMLRFEAALEVVMTVDRAIDDLVEARGIDGGMGVVLGLTEAQVEALVASTDGCDVACVNAATQMAISGDRATVARVLVEADRAGALAVHQMPMGKPMHSRCLQALVETLDRLLERVPVSVARLPVISHLDGSRVSSPSEARRLLARQLGRTVRWPTAVRRLVELGGGATPLLECGAGNVLTRLARWIDRGVTARALSDPATWDAMLGAAARG